MSAWADIDRSAVEQFVYREARLADQHRYSAWEALWTDDAIYWVPAADDGDPATTMSIIHDNRHRLATRIKQLNTGRRHAQDPPSHLARTVSNIELLGAVGGSSTAADDRIVEATFILLEGRQRGTECWGGRVTYHLRADQDGLRMSYKKVDLVNRAWVVPTLAFVL